MLFLWSFLLLFPLFGEDEEAKRLGFIFEGSFENHEIARTPERSKKTLLVPFYEWDYGVRPFSKELWKTQNFDWERFEKIAAKVADDLVDTMQHKLIRDNRGIIEYALIHDKDPFLTGILTSSRLLEKFRESLGDRIHVVLIDRNLIYLFPATGGTIDDYGPALVNEFRSTPLPVSLEVFLLDENGYRVIGELNRDTSAD